MYMAQGTMEFGLYLLEDSVQGADVGKYLHTATVKIIDTAAFPTNDLISLVKGGDKVGRERFISERSLLARQSIKHLIPK